MRRALRSVLLALLLSLAAGFALGTCLRHEAERPTVYIGRAEAGARAERAVEPSPSHPGNDVSPGMS